MKLKSSPKGEGFSPIPRKRTLKVGDTVQILQNIRDAYGEIWHDSGDTLSIKKFTDDGKGVLFGSDLGVSYKAIRKI